MAKYEIEYACGHAGVEQLYGPGKDRERKIVWLGTKNCPECLSKERADVAAHMADYDREVLGLPELVGSEKQVIWATQIRHQAFADFARIEVGLAERANDQNAKVAALAEQAIFELDALVEEWHRTTNAYWWIEHKSDLEYGAVKIHLQRMVEELADAMRDLVVSDIGLSASDARDVLRIQIQQRKDALQARRQAEANSRRTATTAEADARAAEQRKLWERKDRLAQAIHAVIGADSEATVSTYYKGTEKRIYCDVGFGRRQQKTCLFVTGNKYQRPGSIAGNEMLRAALELCERDWKNVRVTVGADGKAK